MHCLRMHINVMDSMDTTMDIPIIAAEEDAVCNAEEIVKEAVVDVSTVI